MSDEQQMDPWAKIRELEAELAELRGELRTCHDMLDGAGVSQAEGVQSITRDNPSMNVRLPARLQRFIVHAIGCPMRRMI